MVNQKIFQPNSHFLTLLEFLAAFEMVNHKTLLSKHMKLKLSGPAMHGFLPFWLGSYIRGFTYPPGEDLHWIPANLSSWFSLVYPTYACALGEDTSSVASHITAMLMTLNSTFLSSLRRSCFNSHPSKSGSSWMAAHHLKLNPSKTELLYIPGDTSPHQNFCDLASELSVHTIVQCTWPWCSSGQSTIILCSYQ